MPVIDRGTTQAPAATPAQASLDSGTFTPTPGALIGASVGSGNNDGGGGTATYTMSASGFTTDTWSIVEEHFINDGGTFSIKSYIAVARVTSATPTSGHVTATIGGGSSGQGTYILQVCEVIGQANPAIGLHASADDARASGATLSIPYGGTPHYTSVGIGIISDNNGPTTGASPPATWTETSDIGDTPSGTSYDAGYRIGQVVASPQFSGLQSGTFGKSGSVVEIRMADAGVPPPSRPGPGRSPDWQWHSPIGVDAPPVVATASFFVPILSTVPFPLLPVQASLILQAPQVTTFVDTNQPFIPILTTNPPPYIVPFGDINTVLDPNVAETVPVPDILIGTAVKQPVQSSVTDVAFNASDVETVPVPKILTGTSVKQPVAPSSLVPGMNPSVVETVPVPDILQGTARPITVPTASIALGLPDQSVETVPVPNILVGTAIKQPVQPSSIYVNWIDPAIEYPFLVKTLYSTPIPYVVPQGNITLGLQAIVVNTGGQFIPVLTGTAIPPKVFPSFTWVSLTPGTPPQTTTLAQILYGTSTRLPVLPSFLSTVWDPSVVESVPVPTILRTPPESQPLAPSFLVPGLNPSLVESVPVIPPLRGSSIPQGVKPSSLLTGAWPQTPIPVVFPYIKGRAADVRILYPSKLYVWLTPGIAPITTRTGLVIISFAADTVDISFASYEVDISFDSYEVDISFAAYTASLTLIGDTVEVSFQV